MRSSAATVATVALIAAIGAACRAPHPPQAVVPVPSADSQPSLVITEIDEGGVAHPGCRCVRAFADINSLVRITPELGAGPAAGPTQDEAGIGSPRTKTLRALADSVRATRELLNPLL